MNPTVTPQLDSSTVALRLGMCAAALAGTAAVVPDAHAAIIVTNQTIAIPQTLAGVYINLLTGATGGSYGTVPGWDFNPYVSNSGAQLGFYWDTSAGGVAASTASGPYLDLSGGAVVSSASTFTRAITGTTGSPYLTAGNRVLGFQFFNESTSAVNYGAMFITTGSGAGFPATITGWAYDNTGAAIQVPEPSTGLMLSAGALALGALQMRKLRRQRREQAH